MLSLHLNIFLLLSLGIFAVSHASYVQIDDLCSMLERDVVQLDDVDFAIQEFPNEIDYYLCMGSKVMDRSSTRTYYSGKTNWELGSYCRSKSPSDRTLFNVGGIAKMFTAATMLRFMDDKPEFFPNDLNTKLSHYLPYLSSSFKDWTFLRRLSQRQNFNQITLLNLLQHNSGLGDYRYTKNEDYMDICKFEIEDDFMCNEEDVILVPEQYCYSSIGYNLLGMIMRALAKDSYTNLLRKYVLRPLNLAETFTAPEVENTRYGVQLSNKNSGYDIAQSYTFYNNIIQPTKKFSWDTSASGVYSSLNDLLKFTYNFFRNDNTFFSEKARRLRDSRPVAADGGLRAGVGYFVYPNGDKGHSGSDFGTKSRVLYNSQSNTTKAMAITSERVTSKLANLILPISDFRNYYNNFNFRVSRDTRRNEIIKGLRRDFSMDQVLVLTKINEPVTNSPFWMYKLTEWNRFPYCFYY